MRETIESMSTVAVDGVSDLQKSRGWWGSWALLAAFITLWVGGIYIAVDRSQITREETIQALRSSNFDVPLPAGVDLQRSMSSNDPLGIVVFSDGRETPHASGSAVSITYFVKGSVASAQEGFEALRDRVPEVLSRKNFGFAPFKRASVTSLSTESVCLTGPHGASCDFVVGEVRVEVVSILPAFDPSEGYHLDELSLAAYRHIAGILHRG